MGYKIKHLVVYETRDEDLLEIKRMKDRTEEIIIKNNDLIVESCIEPPDMIAALLVGNETLAGLNDLFWILAQAKFGKSINLKSSNLYLDWAPEKDKIFIKRMEV